MPLQPITTQIFDQNYYLYSEILRILIIKLSSIKLYQTMVLQYYHQLGSRPPAIRLNAASSY